MSLEKYMILMGTPTLFWWQREDLQYHEDRLFFCGHDVAELAQALGTPIFFYGGRRLLDNCRRLQMAMKRAGIPAKFYYAMKANRFVPLLTYLRASGFGVDVCSTQEMRLALACGYSSSQLSFTSHGISSDEARFLSAFPATSVNCDTLSAIEVLSKNAWRGEIGLRINPGIGLSRDNNDKLSYAGGRATKFGIYAEQFDEAMTLAKQCGMRVTRLHCHAGCGYLDSQLDVFDRILEVLSDFARRVPDLKEINLGGGIGLPHRQNETALNLTRWTNLIRDRIVQPNVTIAIEPGDYIVKDSGMLVLRANYSEIKKNQQFVGLDGGFNLAIEPAFYDLPCEPVPCLRRIGPLKRVTLAGNINEALDIWAYDTLMPPIHEGDYMALLNAGGYAASMSSNHCMRGQFSELLLSEREGDDERWKY